MITVLMQLWITCTWFMGIPYSFSDNDAIYGSHRVEIYPWDNQYARCSCGSRQVKMTVEPLDSREESPHFTLKISCFGCKHDHILKIRAERQ
jgi:hypothetical protein